MANRAQVRAGRRERELAEAKLLPVPPRAALRRARITAAIVVGGPVASVVNFALLVRFLHLGQGWLAPGICLGPIPALGPWMLWRGQPAAASRSADPRYWTFDTATGRRTLDSASLVRVRRMIVPRKGAAWYDALILTDTHRVRVATQDADTVAAVTSLVVRQRAGGLSQRPQIAVSRSAAERMGLLRRPWWVGAIRGTALFLAIPAGILGGVIAAAALAVAVSGG